MGTRGYLKYYGSIYVYEFYNDATNVHIIINGAPEQDSLASRRLRVWVWLIRRALADRENH